MFVEVYKRTLVDGGSLKFGDCSPCVHIEGTCWLYDNYRSRFISLSKVNIILDECTKKYRSFCTFFFSLWDCLTSFIRSQLLLLYVIVAFSTSFLSFKPQNRTAFNNFNVTNVDCFDKKLSSV